MHRTLKYALLAALAFGAVGAVFFHPIALLAADKPKRSAPAEAQPKASDRFGAVRGWTFVCTVTADDNDFAYDDRVIHGAGHNKFKVTRRASIVARIDLHEFKEGKAFF